MSRILPSFAWCFLWLRFVCFGQVPYDNADERLLANIFACFKYLIDYNGDFFGVDMVCLLRYNKKAMQKRKYLFYG